MQSRQAYQHQDATTDLVKRSNYKQKPLVVANPAFNLLKPFIRKQESELIAITISKTLR